LDFLAFGYLDSKDSDPLWAFYAGGNAFISPSENHSHACVPEMPQAD